MDQSVSYTRFPRSTSVAIGGVWATSSINSADGRTLNHPSRQAGVQGFGSKLVTQFKLKQLMLVNRIDLRECPSNSHHFSLQ